MSARGHRRLTALDLRTSDDDDDDESDSDAADRHVDEDHEGEEATVISRVHAGLASLDELVRGRDRVRRCDRIMQMNLFGNRLVTLDGLHRFASLQELCLSNNQLEDLSFHELDPLKLLRVLDLSANRLSSLRGLPLLPRLEELSVAHNRLTGLETLLRPVKLPKLRYLDVRGNLLASPVALVPLQHLKRLVHLRLQSQDGAVSNPICELEEYPDALLAFLPTLKRLDEEDVVLLQELSRVRMPKYHSAARRIQTRAVDGSSQTTPAKLSATGASGVRVFAESRERVGFHVKPADSPKPPVTTAAAHPPEPISSARRTEPQSMQDNLPPGPALQTRVVLREVSTNTELNFEKAILDRETIILEKQATILAREQEFLQKETEFFAKEKLQQEEMRQLQGRLTAALERTAQLESQASQTAQEWELKLLELERRRERVDKDEADHAGLLQQLKDEVARLESENASLSGDLVAKDAQIARIKEEASRAHESDSASVKDSSTRMHSMETTLKEMEDRCRDQDRQLKSQQESHDTRIERLSQHVTRLETECSALRKLNEENEKRLHDMKLSRDQFRDECLHKDDELYRSKKTLMQKLEEIEELRVQLMKAAERQDRIQQQQQQLYEKQLQASVMQLEMEFRREHQQATEKLQIAYRKYQDVTRQLQRIKSAYESSLKRETLLKDEVQRLSSIVEGDKQKLVDQELTKRAEYEFKIQRLQDDKQALQDELVLFKEDQDTTATLKRQLDESHDENDQLRGEIKRREETMKEWETKEGDWKAALKVKDTMLNDQLRQLEDLRKQNKKLEDEYQQDTGEFQGQIEELEEALDESLEKIATLQEKYDRAKAALAEKEESSSRHSEKLDVLAKQIELKNAALELIEGEMDRMRDTLSKQDDLFQKRLVKHLDQHRDELERARVAKEEVEVSLRKQFEQQQLELLQKYDKLAEDLKDMASQNTKLRVALEQEKKRVVQSDREMRVLLAQLDRERHIKNERLGDIKRLFEQLQQETP